jgi:spore germination protein YaaH
VRRLLLIVAAAALLIGVGAALAVALGRGQLIARQRPVVSLGGQPVDSGAQGIPPQPTFSVRLGNGGRAADYQARLDGGGVSLREIGASEANLSLAAQPQGTWHHLEIWRPGTAGHKDDDVQLDFRIVEPLQMAVGWLSGPDATRAQVTWSRQPADVGALVALLQSAGASATSESNSVVATWAGARAGQKLGFTIPDGFAASDGGYLAAAFRPETTVGAGAAAVQLSEEAEGDGSGLRLQVYYVSNPQARADLARHARKISVVSPTFYSVDGGGGLHSNIDADALAIARQNGVEVQPLVNNQDFNREAGHQLLTNPGANDQLAAALVAEARNRGYSGYQLDFENLAPSDKDNLSQFSSALASRLQAAGLRYSVAVIPRRASTSLSGPSGVYDYPALTAGAGWLTMMAYDQHTRQEDPGPVAGLDWVQQVTGFSSARIDPGHVYLGVPLYGRDFSLAGAPASRPYADVVAAVAQNSGTISWQFAISTARAEYLADGVQHVAWIDTRASLAAKVELAKSLHLAGVSAWRLGFEDPDFWSLWPSR